MEKKSWLIYHVLLWVFLLPIQANETVDILSSRLDNEKMDTLQIELLLQMGDQFEHTDFESTMHFYFRALDLARESQKKATDADHKARLLDLEIKSLRYIAYVSLTWGEYQKAEEYYQEILEHYQKQEYLRGSTRVLVSLGNIQYFQSLYPKALDFYLRGLQIAEDNQFTKQMADLKLNIANVHYQTGSYVKSLDFFQQSLPLYDSIDDFHNRGLVYIGLGNIHSSLNNFEKSLNNYKTALEYFDELADHYTMANIYLSMGTLFFDESMYQEAEEYYQLSLQQANRMQNNRVAAQSLLNMGIMYARKQEYKKALQNYEQALELAKESGHEHVTAVVLRNKALALAHNRNFHMAGQLAEEGLKIARKIESMKEQAESYRVISHIQAEQGNYKQALDYHKRYKAFSDSVMDIEKQKQLNEMDAVFQAEKNQQKIEMQSLELEKNQAEIKRKNQIVNSFIIGFVFLVILVTFFIFHFSQKKITNRELRKKQEVISETNKILKEKEQQNNELRHSKQQLSKRLNQNTHTLDTTRLLAKRIKNILLPGEDSFRNVYKNDYFIFNHPEGESLGSFVWLHQKDNQIIQVFCNCVLSSLQGTLVCLPIIGRLQQLADNNSLNNPGDMIDDLKKYYNALTKNIKGFNQPELALKLSVMVIDKNRLSIKYAGYNLPLYMAIARNPEISLSDTPTEYQELQQLKPESLPSHEKTKEHPTHYFKLKSFDRLYLISTPPDNNSANNSSLAQETTFKITRLLDANQDKKLENQESVIRKNMTSWVKRKETVAEVHVAGFQL